MAPAPNVHLVDRRIHSMGEQGLSVEKIAQRFDRSAAQHRPRHPMERDSATGAPDWTGRRSNAAPGAPAVVPGREPRAARPALPAQRRFIKQVEELVHYRRGLALPSAEA